MLERHRDGLPMISLDFDHTVFERPPTPARLFEVFRQGSVVVRGQVQIFDQRHHLAATSFRGTLYQGGLLGRREGRRWWGGWPPFAQVTVVGRIYKGIIVDGHTGSFSSRSPHEGGSRTNVPLVTRSADPVRWTSAPCMGKQRRGDQRVPPQHTTMMPYFPLRLHPAASPR